MQLGSATRVTLALLAGALVGIGLKSARLAGALEPIGALWINAVRMPVIPLVVSLLITTLGSTSDVRRVGTLGVRAIILFVGILAVFVGTTTVVAPWLFAPLTLDPTSTTTLRAAAVNVGRNGSATFGQWLAALIPGNPIRAASDDLLLPMVILGMVYGLAVARLDSDARGAQIRFFTGVSEVMLTIVRWVIAVAPVGVFALAVVLGVRLGLAALGAMAYYLAIVIGLVLAAALALYAATVVFGGVALGRLARALLPAQAVAFSSRSSLATLPLLLEQASPELQLPKAACNFVLPLAAGIFKPAVVAWPVGALFVARLYGLELNGLQLTILAVGTVVLSFSSPGIPSGAFLVQAPLYTALGLPLEGLGILMALDAVPDLFKTALNTTGYLGAAAILGRQSSEAAPQTAENEAAAAHLRS